MAVSDKDKKTAKWSPTLRVMAADDPIKELELIGNPFKLFEADFNPGGKRGSVLGQTFFSKLSKIDQNQTTVDPAVTAQKEAGLGMASESVLDTQQARTNTLGADFIDNKTLGLKEGLNQRKEDLNTRLQKTGVTGAFAEQSRETLAADSAQKLKTGEAMAFDEFINLANSFDILEKSGINLNEMVRSSNFQQAAQARGMSSDVLAKLNAIDLQSEANFQGKKAGGQGMAGNLIGTIASLFSSRSFKHDMTPISNNEILSSMMSLDVETWKYNGENETHIGCYAEDFNHIFGEEGKKTIDVVDIIGVLMASIQAQQTQIQELKDA